MQYLVVTVAFWLCWLSPAYAWTIEAEVANARAYWASQEMRLPCEPTWTVEEIADPRYQGWGAPLPACHMKFEPETLTYTRSRFCHLAIHEYGHVLGLDHPDWVRFSIMAEPIPYAMRIAVCDGATKIGLLTNKPVVWASHCRRTRLLPRHVSKMLQRYLRC